MACLSYLPQLIFIFLIPFVLFTFTYRKRCFIKKKYEVKKIEKCIAKLFYFKLVFKNSRFLYANVKRLQQINFLF